MLQQIPFGDESDAGAAIDAASEAFESWSHLTAYQRGAVLEKAALFIESHAEEFARITTEEAGKPLKEAYGEWVSAPNYFRWAAEEARRVYGRSIPARVAGRRIDVIYQPIGVVGVITAWNFPVYNQTRAVAAALAAGCTVVSRPSEYTPRSAMLIAHALAESGLPAGVHNVVNGKPHEIGQAMLDDPRVRKIHFTGLDPGREAPHGWRLADCHPPLPGTRRKCPGDRLSRCRGHRRGGQERAWWPRFATTDRSASPLSASTSTREWSTSSVRVPWPRPTVRSSATGLDDGTTIGPLINAVQRDRVEELVSTSVEQGATVLTGGHRLDGAGYFYQPTVLTDVKPGSPVHEQEIFGPVMPIVPFSDVDEVIALANATDYGLASYVYTRDLATAFKVSEELAVRDGRDQRLVSGDAGGTIRRDEAVGDGTRVGPGRGPRVPGAEDAVLGDRELPPRRSAVNSPR